MSDENAFYLGYTQRQPSDTWEWQPDEEGRVFVDILSNRAAELWREAVVKHKLNPDIDDAPFPSLVLQVTLIALSNKEKVTKATANFVKSAVHLPVRLC